MGVVADAVLEAGGVVVGVIPAPLATREVAHSSLTELVVVETMHERKAKMAELADAFLALPGGFGTFDELFEILTWAQLGIHRKPIGLLNISGYFDPLLALVEQAQDRALPLSGRQRAHAYVQQPTAGPHRHAAVLREAPLSNVELGHDLDA